MNDIFDLREKRILIAGGGGDIGFACARAYGTCGATVLLFDIHEDRVRQGVERLRAEGFPADGWCGSITDPVFLEEMAGKIGGKYGSLDVLMHCAGVTSRKPMLEMSQKEWTEVIDVNLNGVFLLLKTFGNAFCGQGHGKVIQILSTGAYRFGPNFSSYGASKAGASALIKSLALEWAPYHVQVNGIAPTATETNFTRDYYLEHPEKKAAAIKNHPYQRLGTPEDYVGAAIFLASSASDFVNGEVIIVDSGKTV